MPKAHAAGIQNRPDLIKGRCTKSVQRPFLKYVIEKMQIVSYLMIALRLKIAYSLQSLHAMCVNEVRKINGIIDCEDAVQYQRD